MNNDKIEDSNSEPEIPTRSASLEPEPNFSKLLWKEKISDWIFWGGPLLVVLLILLIAGFFVAKEFFPGLFEPTPAVIATPDRATAVVPNTPVATELPDADTLLGRVVMANGGRDKLMNLISLQVNGVLTAGEEEFSFSLARRTPGLALLTLKSKSREVTDGIVDGKHWRRIERVGKPTEFQILNEGDQSTLGRDVSSFFDPLLTYALESGSKKGVIRNSSYEGDPTYLLTFNMDGRDIQAEIGVETYHTLAIREATIVEGLKRELLMEFNDYRSVSGISLPFTYSTYLDGEEIQKIVIDSVKMNYGVISSLFDMPEELRQQ